MKKIFLAGIIAAIIIGIIVVGYSSIPQSREITNQPESIPTQPESSGRNLTINLNEGLNLRSSP